MYKLGIDIGSTTVKIAVLDEDNNILFSDYERHYANIVETLTSVIKKAFDKLGDVELAPMITGSGGLSISKNLDIPFVQEVVAVASSLKDYAPQTDVAIELGGEDAKIIYFTGGLEQRMNGICAGGTGSFIDQMATLLTTDAAGLNRYAKEYKAIYPIAARCGVFAKSDIQPLINEGATKEDLAASIFQAVVNQTISGLACGKPIRGNVAFLGGPLHFLSELKNSFIRTLKLSDNQVIAPDHSHLFAAVGAAINTEYDKTTSMNKLIHKLDKGLHIDFEVSRMEPLFLDKEDYRLFLERQKDNIVAKADLSSYKGDCFLGIDAGSTTTKAALVGEDGTLLYSFYSSNNGSPLKTTIKAISEIHRLMPASAKIVRSCSTGYGEALIKSALMLDEGEVETVAHYKAAAFFEPDVDCILDIGGQDMKCIKIKNNTVDKIQLNEACSSGCGSFIETFAKSLGYSVEDFAKIALFAKNPIDLGSRCTVFMNSKVKQAQKEGATVEDISAGLAYSVIKNALLKVIKLTDPKDLGEKIVVQGGTFYNDAVLKSFERISRCKAVRPDIAGIMGAFGAALIAREHYKGQDGSMMSFEKIENLKFETMMTRCKGCTNSCLLTINKFDGGRQYVSGNRCERGLGKEKNKDKIPNMFDFKEKLLFNIPVNPFSNIKRGKVGIARVLNMYENYPFWVAFFTRLGYEVVLSPRSNRKMYELGIESIPSESECYPAKLVHGHVMWLINKKVDFIFYPCVVYERKEIEGATNHYNCPIVASYGENIRNNVEEIRNGSVIFKNPFMSFEDEKIIADRMVQYFSEDEYFKNKGITNDDIIEAVKYGFTKMLEIKHETEKEGERILKYLDDNDKIGIVLAGRPYHLDPEVNHGIPELINSYGVAVLTEDSIAHLGKIDRPTMAADQWTYHSRLYAAASYVRKNNRLELIQLNSFGCGLDAVTTDQVNDILQKSNKIYTVLKIDEVNNLGAARIRIRSLLSAVNDRKDKDVKSKVSDSSHHRILFTKEMKKNYTILCPEMSPIHFEILLPALASCGYNLELLPSSKSCVNYGLKYVNNDACYPSLLVVGQIMEALLSGKYDLNKTAVIITQTGGGCRATNYIGFIRRALQKAGMPQIPVISLSPGVETNPGFSINYNMVNRALQSLVYGDLFMRVLYKTRPYEKIKGSADKLHRKWVDICIEDVKKGNKRKFKKNIIEIVKEFDNLELCDIKKPKVGIVGEILVKFSPIANNYLVELLEEEGAEAVCPDLLDFFLYCFWSTNYEADYFAKGRLRAAAFNIADAVIEHYRKPLKRALKKSKRFESIPSIKELSEYAKPFVSIGNQNGEGWFLTAEMVELIKEGVPNIICAQPFACLPNHVVGKGVIKVLRDAFKNSNIVAVDYDPGASEVNQLNRIKLMLSAAKSKVGD